MKVRKVPRSLVFAFPGRACVQMWRLHACTLADEGKKRKKESSKHVCGAQEAPDSSAESRPRTEFGQALTQKVNNTGEKEGGEKGRKKSLQIVRGRRRILGGRRGSLREKRGKEVTEG